jgi:hypothetical protein
MILFIVDPYSSQAPVNGYFGAIGNSLRSLAYTNDRWDTQFPRNDGTMIQKPPFLYDHTAYDA